jgi:hypothetical protein
MRGMPVGVGGVDVQVDDDFAHDPSVDGCSYVKV